MKRSKFFSISCCLVLFVIAFSISEKALASPSPTPSPEPTLDPELYPVPTFDLDGSYNNPQSNVMSWYDYVLFSQGEPIKSYYEATGGMRNPPNSTVMSFRSYKYIYDIMYTPPIRYVNRYGTMGTSKPAFYQWLYSGSYYEGNQLTGATSANTQFQLSPFTQSYYVEAKSSYLSSSNYNDGKDVRYWIQIPGFYIQYADSNYRPAVYCSLSLCLKFQDGTSNTFFGLVTTQELASGCYIDGDAEGKVVTESEFLLTIYCDGVNNLLTIPDDSSGMRSPVDPPDLGGEVFLQSSSGIRCAEMLIDSKLPTTQNNLLLLVKRFFVPDYDSIQVLMSNLVSDINTNEPAGGLSFSKYIFVRLLDLFSDISSSSSAPVLHIPALNISMSDGRYQYFAGYDFDFSTLPANLLVYTRMVGDVVLVSGFIGFLWILFTRFYGSVISSGKRS